MPGTGSPVEAHKEGAPKQVRFSVVVVSDSKYEAKRSGFKVDDVSGTLIADYLREAGHRMVGYEIVPDDVNQIVKHFEGFLRSGSDVVIFTGGTGIARRDVTVEAVKPRLDKVLEGFGELFRYLSYEEVGSAAFLSRAFAGVIGGKVVFCLPGSPNAVKLALEKLILPEVGHLMKMLRS